MSLSLSFLLFFVSCSSVHSEESLYKEVYPPVDLTDSSVDPSRHLFFALVQSFGVQFNGSGNIAGVKVALDRINNSTDILPNHTLHYTLTDSQCQRSTALDALFTQILSNDGISKVAVLGCGCSVATEPTAEVSHYFNITHVSCSTSSAEVTDRKRFRRYFQLVQSIADIADIFKGLINFYQWKYVSLIVQNENLHTAPMNLLKDYLHSTGVGFSEVLFESETGLAGHREPIDSKARIFIIAAYETNARSFLCEAYRKDLQYPGHLIIFPGWYPTDEWWLIQTQDLSCTPEQRESIMKHVLTVHHYNFFVPDEQESTSGIIGAEFKAEYDRVVQGPPKYNKIQTSPYCYDATWTLAYALNRTLQEYPEVDVQYSNIDFHQSLFSSVNSSNFVGITGPVWFNNVGIRRTNIRQVFQVKGEGKLAVVKVGEVARNASGEFMFEASIEESELWPAGVPRDGVAINSTEKIHVSVTTIFSLLATTGIAFAVICLVFNFYFRDKKLIKLSSPNLNYLIIAGAIILYVDIYIHVVPTSSEVGIKVLCSLTPWFTAIGYSLSYGTIVAKMVRVYIIFSNPKPNSTSTLKDWKLAVGVLTLVVIDLVILSTFTLVEGLNGVETIATYNKENPSTSEEGFGVVVFHYITVCKSTVRDIFLGLLYGYKALLQVIALILTFTTRKVKVKGLNDAIYVAAAIYVTSLLWAVIIVSTYSLAEYLNVFTVVFCLGLFVGTSVVMALVFIPKMVSLYKDPEGKKVFSSHYLSHASKNASTLNEGKNSNSKGSAPDPENELNF